MPIQSKDLDATSGDAFDFSATSEDYIVEQRTYVESEAARGVSSHGFANVSVVNDGMISAYAQAIYFDAAQCQLTNGSNAEIYGSYGAYATSSDDVFDNEGEITGTNDGLFDNGGKASIDNDGDVSGRYVGVALSGDGNTLYNSGNIYGTESGTGIGVEMDTTAKGQSASLENKGLIRGTSVSVGAKGAGAVSIENESTLDGNLTLANTGGDSVTNRGQIDGNVVLGNGTNTFDDRGGSVSGTITGGTGVDTIFAGKHGDTIFGGNGHDLLHGGAGHDTFAYNSYASSSSDTIFGFSVSDDTVQFDHTVFTKLAAGATPAFTIGSAASSATDYLFYNSTTGQLFYDPDGNGSGKADLIANLGHGLKLTAANFKVV